MFVNNLRPIWQINDSLLYVLHESSLWYGYDMFRRLA